MCRSSITATFICYISKLVMSIYGLEQSSGAHRTVLPDTADGIGHSPLLP
jgi:hypothetical protein